MTWNYIQIDRYYFVHCMLRVMMFNAPYVAGPLSKPVYFSEEAGCFSTPSNHITEILLKLVLNTITLNLHHTSSINITDCQTP
jgi:hypothetical protein